MGSPSSSRSHRNKSAATNPLRQRLAAAFALCSSYRYTSLGIVSSAGALLVMACWSSFNSPAALVNDDEDELAAFDHLDGLEADLGEEVSSHPIRVPVPRLEQHAGFDDLVPMFAGNSAPEPGIVSAMFQGPPRSVDAGPVWLAGTIETDDIAPEGSFLPAIPAPVFPTTGPLLTPP